MYKSKIGKQIVLLSFFFSPHFSRMIFWFISLSIHMIYRSTNTCVYKNRFFFDLCFLCITTSFPFWRSFTLSKASFSKRHFHPSEKKTRKSIDHLQLSAFLNHSRYEWRIYRRNRYTCGTCFARGKFRQRCRR